MMSKSMLVLFCCGVMVGCAKPTDPESLTPGSGGYAIVGRVQTPGYAQDVEVRDTLAYIAQGEGGLAIVSVAKPESPRVMSVCLEGVRGYSSKVALLDSTVYVAAGGFGVNVINVSNPDLPFAAVSNVSIKPAQSFHVFGSYLLTAIGESGVKIADITTPTNPDPRGGLQNPGFALGITTTADSAYLLVACGEMGMAMYDVRDMQGGFGSYNLVGWTDTPGYANDVAVMPDRPVAFLACGFWGLYVVDFSDTSNVRVVGHYATGGYAKEIAFHNGRVYVTTEGRGLQVFAVANPASPQLVGAVGTEYAIGVCIGQGYLYVADRDEGLLVISIPLY
jgi:hypothetical protein